MDSLMKLNIERVENGYILYVIKQEIARPDKYVFKDLKLLLDYISINITSLMEVQSGCPKPMSDHCFEHRVERTSDA